MKQKDLHNPRHRFVILTVLGVSNTIGQLIALTMGILLPSITDDLGLSPTEQGWLGSSALIGNLVLAIPLTLVVSRFNASLATTITLTLGAFFVLVQGWAPIFLVLIIGRGLYGLSLVAREPARALLTAQWFPPREIVIANGLMNGTFGLAWSFAFLFTPFLLVMFDDNWRATLTLYAIVYFAVTIVWMVVGRERKTEEYQKWSRPRTGGSLRNALRYKELWYISAGLFGAEILWGSITTFWPTLMLQKYDISLTVSGTIHATSGIIEALGGIFVAFYVAKRDVQKEILSGSGVVLVATSIGMVLTGSIPLQIILNMVHGLGWAFFPIILSMPFGLKGIKPREIAVAVVFLELNYWGGAALGPVLAGFLQELTNDLTTALIVTSACGVSLILGGLMLPRQKGQGGVATPTTA